MPESFMNQHFKNRTDDFRRKMTSGGVEEMTQLIPSKTKKTSSVFLQTAQQVSKQIHSTGMKLKKLSSLAKKKSLFDDPTVEINELTFVIKKEIKVLQSTLEDLDKTYGKRKSTQSQSHNAGIVGCLETDIEKIVKAFLKILEERSQNIQEQQKSRQTLVGNTPTVSNTLKYSNLFEEAQNGDEISLDMDMESEQIQQMERYNHQESQLSEVQRIERTLVELHTIFTRMGEMLMEHDVTIGRIDRDIEDATENTWRGQQEIMEYWQNLSSNRWLYAKIFVVLIAFIIAWVVLFV